MQTSEQFDHYTALKDQDALVSSAEYSELASALDVIAPLKQSTSKATELTLSIPDEPDVKDYFDEDAPGWAHHLVISGTVYRFGGLPVPAMEGEQRKTAIQSIIDSVYKYDVKPVCYEVVASGVKFTWNAADVWHPAFMSDIFVHPSAGQSSACKTR